MFGIESVEQPPEACAFGPFPSSRTRLSDREIRRALNGLFQVTGWIAPDLLVEEVECMRGYVRADYLCLRDDHLSVIEIKSDRDTLSRFDEQVRVYAAIADRVTLIVGWNLAARALHKAPPWWEVLLAEHQECAGPRFVTLRDGSRNPEVDTSALLSMLPIADLRVLAARLDLRRTNQPRRLRELIALRASPEDLREAVRSWLTRISDQRKNINRWR